MTNTTTTTGVATLKKLQKECLTIDLSKVEYKRGYDFTGIGWESQKFNTDKQNLNPNIRMGRGDIHIRPSYKGFTTPLWDEVNQRVSTQPYRFQGGTNGKSLEKTHHDFTDTKILVDKFTNQIVEVLYALDNDYLNEWLRQTIDPNIPNNWDELHTEKEFEVLITTTTYSQEKVKVVGRSYYECVETMKQNDPMIKDEDMLVGIQSDRFSGMKTTSTREGAKPIPSSYEEWVSLQEKEVA
jgi:hypothetical protein